MLYKDEYKKRISMPLGGIGTGCIGLAGNGGFRDIEIFNRPNKCSGAEFTHFAVKAEDEGKVLDVRALNTDLESGYAGSLERERYTGYGFGPDRGSMAGFPHFERGEFQGKFPLAALDFEHDMFPGKVAMEAFNPFIPANEDDSSIPAVFFQITIHNTADKELAYTLALTCNNYYEKKNACHTYRQTDGVHTLYLSNTGEKDSTQYGDLAIATDCEDASFQEYWFRGSWFDNASVFWQDFSRPGRLKNRSYFANENGHQVFAGRDIATLAAHVRIPPGASKKIRFVLSWSMPYMKNTWQITHIGLNRDEIKRRRSLKWKNYYATLFHDSRDSALYAIKNFGRLYRNTMKYVDLLYASSLPEPALDAVAAGTAVLKSPTCLRLEDGSFYGFEGVHAHMGSCEGTCTHVWSYAYAAAFLFPRLERSARRLEYTRSLREDGGMGFRLQLPLGVGPANHRAAIDGQFGTVLRVYREFLISGDRDWLASLWPLIKKSIAFAWDPRNPDRWDLDKDGIAEGRQHHTLDMELFSPNAWLSGMYLAGLKAGARLAGIMDDKEAYDEYMQIFSSGVSKLNRDLFNGEYFYQDICLEDKELLAGYHEGMSDHSQDVLESYWNEESGQIKYQIGEGCGIDQVLGQWHADLLGLGDIFDRDKVLSALRAVYRHNYIPVMREHVNPCRIYSLNGESGTVICSYPEGRRKPHIPVPYAEETMHGFEYQAASHMILRGLEDEGLACVKAVRDKYDGKRRNPYNEMECGSNYARSMASYALLLAYSGFRCDMDRKWIRFSPLHKGDARFFFAVDSGFGEVRFEGSRIALAVACGCLEVWNLDFGERKVRSVSLGGRELPFRTAGGEIALETLAVIHEGQELLMEG